MIIPRVPAYIPYFGHAMAFGRDADKLLGDCQKKYGDVFEIKLVDKRVVFFMNPRDYPAFIRNSKNLSSHELSVDIASSVFGFDSAQRKKYVDMNRIEHMTQRFMQGDELAPLTERMQDKVEDILLKQSTDMPIKGSLFDYVLELIFMAGSDALFGDGVASPQLLEDFKVIDRYFPMRVGKVPASFLPGFSAALEGVVKPLGRPYPLQSRLMDERFAYFATLTDYNSAVESPRADAALLWAAQANTAVVAFFTLYFVLRDPQLKKMIQEEVRNVLATSTKKSPHNTPYLTAEVLDCMEKLDSCISETLRLVSAPLPLRQVMEDMDIELVNGEVAHLKKGQYAAMYPRRMHLHPEIYQNPEAFQWDRYLGKQKPNSFSFQGEPLKYSLLPFGIGSSICPGRHFARNEFKVIVALLLNWCDISVEESVMPALDKSRVGLGSLTPKTPIHFQLQRRA